MSRYGAIAALFRAAARRLPASPLLATLALLGIAACSAGEPGPHSVADPEPAQDVGHGRPPIPPPDVLKKLPPDGGPNWNRLVFEKSPYLLQHAGNPVDWYPWGEEAFARARQEDRPILLSIGYSTCHWCHVMEEESFTDADVARLMNENFVCIKVDREERPDVDQIYMTAAQAMTGAGGWPLNVFLTPDRVPFFAGTYFPKTGRGGRPGMMELLPRIAEAWRSQRADVLKASESVRNLLQRPPPAPGGLDTGALVALAVASLSQRYDAENGGFGEAPKFPVSQNLRLLLRSWDRDRAEPTLAMVRKTLDAMGRGGIWDHVGFGFHRYSTDAKWLVPHFEKMLYDQALLAMAYLDGYQATGDDAYRETARRIFTYVQREMTSPEGGFYSAEDADSEGEEGKFYVWQPEEVRAVLGVEEGDRWNRIFDITPGGNFREPHSGATASIPHLKRSVAEWAEELHLDAPDLEARLEADRGRLFAAREERPRPFRDDKILTDWNGLMIASFATGARVLDDPSLAESARRAADFILANTRGMDGRLHKRFRRGDASLDATLEDYAFFGWGLLELYEATFDPKVLEECIAVTRRMTQDFGDEANGGFFLSAAGRTDLLVRSKEVYDGAIPSGNSVAALLLIRLGRITGDASLEEESERTMRAFAAELTAGPGAHGQMMLAVDDLVGPFFEVVIVGQPGAPATEALLTTLRGQFLPRKVVVLRPPDPEGRRIVALVPYAESQGEIDGRATAYVCRDYACQAPTNDPARMLAALRAPDAVTGKPTR